MCDYTDPIYNKIYLQLLEKYQSTEYRKVYNKKLKSLPKGSPINLPDPESSVYILKVS